MHKRTIENDHGRYVHLYEFDDRPKSNDDD